MKRNISTHKLFVFIKKNIFLITLTLFFSWFFLYRIDWLYLDNWDEAWYASIAREMVRSNDLIHLQWNGNAFVDHPPLAIWLMVISFKIFGINEFATRLPSALLGIGSIILIYLVSYELFKKRTVAFVSALVLGSCIWYIIRVRSGNLDSPLVFFYLLTAYVSLKSAANIRLLPVAFASYAMLLLTKTLVGLPMGILILLWNFKHIKQWKWVIASVLLCIGILCSWYVPNIMSSPTFLKRHIFDIGLRNKEVGSFFSIHVQPNLFFLHNGIGKWFYPFLLSLPLAGIFVFINNKRKELMFLLLWLFLIAYPFFTSDKTQIWHLIPLYVPIALLVPYIIYECVAIVKIRYLSGVFVLLIGIMLSAWNLKAHYTSIFPTSNYIPDEVSIAQEASKHKDDIFLNGEFIPRIVFYSGRNVTIFAYKPDSLQQMISAIKKNQQPLLVITHVSSQKTIEDNQIKVQKLQQKGDIVLLKIL